MNLQQLRALTAILECKSFSAAANRIGLSHSAISLQIKSLEDEMGRPLFDRQTRPPLLTPSGRRAAEVAQQALAMIENVKLLGSGKMEMDTLSIGVVPTTLQDVLPRILDQVQKRHPKLQMKVKSGLSGELTSQVLNRELDAAIVTSPMSTIPQLTVHELVSEPIFVIGPCNANASTDTELLQERPFIAFSRKTWLGQQISSRLQARGIFIDEIMEVDSLDAIERMVEDGFGVSIVPERFLSAKLSDKLTQVPFCNPQEYRRLSLIHLESMEREKQIDLLLQIAGTLGSK